MENQVQTSATGWQRHLTAASDFSRTPERLSDIELAEMEEFAHSPLPPLETCGPEYFSQCLRMMLAVLPKRQSDDVSGELFVAAYSGALGSYSKPQMTYLCQEAVKRCKWFPTVAECIEILNEWRRSDGEVLGRERAKRLIRQEHWARQDDERKAEFEWSDKGSHRMTQSAVDALPDAVKAIGLRRGYLVKGEDGIVRPLTVQEEPEPSEDGVIW